MTLIDRAPGIDVIVPVLMRKSSFEALCSTEDGRSVPVTEGSIGLVPARSAEGLDVLTFVVWSGEPVWRGLPEQIPGNKASADALKEARQ